MRYATAGEEQHETVVDGLRDALGGSDNSRWTAQHFQELVPDLVDELGLPARMRGLALARPRSDGNTRPAASDGWDDFDLEITTSRATDAERAALKDAAAALRQLARVDQPAARDVELIIDALLSGIAPTLDEALSNVMGHEPRMLKALREHALPVALRQPVGDRLRMAPSR
jgi:hypothetical protein